MEQVVIGKLIFSQLVTNSLVFFVNRKFITTFKTAANFSFSEPDQCSLTPFLIILLEGNQK
jgi:hypothetical protein